MQTNVSAGNQPWIGGWSNLVASTYSQSSRVPNPVSDVVRGCPTTCNENYTSCMQDAAAAYQNALRYVISGNTSNANCAVNILNAWVKTLTTIDTCCSDHALLAGLQGYQFAAAGELMRNYSGWAAADFSAYQNWMRNIWYANNDNFLTTHFNTCISHYWANWDLCNMLSMISIGVLLDDTNIYNEAVNYFKTGAGNGALNQAVYYLHSPGLGQWQESGRDQGHTKLGIGLMGMFCEVAWNQGSDLYSWTTNSKSFYDGLEYAAKYNLTNTVPYVTYNNCDNVNQTSISSTGQGIDQDRYFSWDLVYNAYLRENKTAGNAAQAAALVRPDHGGGYTSTASWSFDHVGFTTLTHYLGSSSPNTNPPAAPTGLTATAGNAQVSLSWTASSGASSYNVYRSTTSGGPYTRIATGITTTSYTDTTVVNGTTYYYVVTAVNANGESGFSNQASATPTCSLAAVPTGLTASPGNNQVALSWTASSGATSYNLKRATVSGGPYTTIASPTTTSYTDTTAVNGTTYYYVVSAVNSCGESANGTEVSATPTCSLAAVPTGLTATPGNNQVALSWTASSGATSYNVKRATVSGGPYTTIASPTTTSYTDTTVVNGTTYYYVVSAVNSCGESANSTEVSATPSTPAVAPAPTNLSASAGHKRVSLTWTQSTGTGLTNNKVYRSTTSGGPYSLVATVSSTTSYNNTGLSSGTTYYYVVTASNSSGESADSNQSSATAK
jgi:fibronectin type 3 domain-containing protein